MRFAFQSCSGCLLGLFIWVSVFFSAGASAQENPPGEIVANDDWKEISFGDLRVKPGSALDFSSLVESGPAGKHGFAQINDRGQLVFPDQPDQPLKLYGCSCILEYGCPQTPEEIETYAEQVRLAGYNLLRPHFLDHMLMIGTAQDGVFNPEQLDRWDRFSAALKAQGIYLYLDLSTSWASYYAMKKQGDNWKPAGYARNFKTRMYWDPAVRDHWKKSITALLTHVNPYTGVALKDEPQVVICETRNEATIKFLLGVKNQGGTLKDDLTPLFRLWLKTKYRQIEALKKAWAGDVTANAAGIAHFDQVIFPPVDGTGLATADLWRFFNDTEIETFRWMAQTVQDLGVKAPCVDFNAANAFGVELTRSAMPVIDNHIYHDHPTAYISPGSKETNESISGRGLDGVVWLAETRQLDRPFLVSEWGSPYWNSWRYEAGLSVPAYASFQGWQMIIQHAEPIELQVKIPLRPFKIAYDPPAKAAERMGVFFYVRGDVAPAAHLVEIDLDADGVYNRMGGAAYMSTGMRRLPLLVKSGLKIVGFKGSRPGATVHPDASLVIDPHQPCLAWNPAEPTGVASATPDPAGVAAYLKKKGLLSPQNQTDAAAGVFQSDTGQLTLRMNEKVITVDTPKSAAAALPQGAPPAKLSAVQIINHGASGAAFVGALDNQPLEKSSRMLLIVVGDALNSHASFKEAERQTLVEPGQLPVLARALDVEFQIQSESLAPWHLWALAYDGSRVEEVPVQSARGLLSLRLQTGQLKTGPAAYFELTSSSAPEN